MAYLVTAPYECTIEKSLFGEFWVNRYFIQAASLADAVTVANNIYDAERLVHRMAVVFTKMAVRTTTVGDFDYQTVVLNTNGLNANPTAHHMPLFVVARVDFTVTGSRPSRKYLRGVLTEDDVNAMDVNAAMVTFINNNYVAALVSTAGLVDPQGGDWIAGSASPKTGIRQLRRGSKKKNIP